MYNYRIEITLKTINWRHAQCTFDWFICLSDGTYLVIISEFKIRFINSIQIFF